MAPKEVRFQVQFIKRKAIVVSEVISIPVVVKLKYLYLK